MAHEQSRTVGYDDGYYNISGRTGEVLQGPYKSVAEAVIAAKQRSENVVFDPHQFSLLQHAVSPYQTAVNRRGIDLSTNIPNK